MAMSCNIIGIVGVRNGRPYVSAEGKNLWRHDGFLPLQAGDQSVGVFTSREGSSVPLDDGVYFGATRVVAHMTANTPALHLFVSDAFTPLPPFSTEDDGRMPPPVFVVAGKISCSNLDVNWNRAFDIDVSQHGDAPQQRIRLRCFYPGEDSRFNKTSLPNAGKHVVLHGHLTGFYAGRCIIRIVDIALRSGDVVGPSGSPSTKSGAFDWKGRKVKSDGLDDEFIL